MTAKEHLAKAEELLGQLAGNRRGWEDAAVLATALEAIGHGLLAVAAELGVPHAPATPAEVPGGQ